MLALICINGPVNVEFQISVADSVEEDLSPMDRVDGVGQIVNGRVTEEQDIYIDVLPL